MNKKKSTDTTPAVDKTEKLKELAEKRVPRAVKAISLCGNLASYKPTEAQVSAILAALEGAVKTARARFYGASPTSSFALPS